jgi:gluconokinase
MGTSPFPLRSPSHKIGGINILARIIDKVRLDAEGQLPEGYNVGFIEGRRTFDDRVCRLLGVNWEPFRQRLLQGGSDEDILEWCFENGRRPDAEQIAIWNGFMEKRGWNDEASEGFARQKAEAGLGHRDDIVTFFHLMDVEEGRAP